MFSHTKIVVLPLSLSLSMFAAVAVQAAEPAAAPHTLGQHPAVLVKAQVTSIDANHFIVQPPASVTWSHTHANADHPAVQAARLALAAGAGIDSNTFLVQPPATTRWTAGPAADAPLQVAVVR